MERGVCLAVRRLWSGPRWSGMVDMPICEKGFSQNNFIYTTLSPLPHFYRFCIWPVSKAQNTHIRTCTSLWHNKINRKSVNLCFETWLAQLAVPRWERFPILAISPKVSELQLCATTHIKENWSYFSNVTKSIHLKCQKNAIWGSECMVTV